VDDKKDNIIDLESERRKKGKFTKEEARLLKIGSDFDSIITKWLSSKDTTVKELAGVLAHRFGSLLRCVTRKEDLWKLCERILKKQAEI
jgi:hypothetical protein